MKSNKSIAISPLAGSVFVSVFAVIGKVVVAVIGKSIVASIVAGIWAFGAFREVLPVCLSFTEIARDS
jgi:uncharacterized protein (DUF697 family)